MSRRYAGIGIAVLLCFLMNVSLVSAVTICEGNVTAQDIVSGTWNYYDVPTNTHNTGSGFYVKYDCAKRSEEMSFSVYDVKAYKETAVRWYYDPSSPSADVIPDSVISIVPLYKYGTSDIVGSVTTRVIKIGSADGTPNCPIGTVNLFFDITITNTSSLPASGSQTLEFAAAPAGGDIDTYYYVFYGQDFTTAEGQMYAQQGFFVCLVRDGANNLYGLPGCKADVTGYPNPHVDYWSLISYYNFKNYYEVNTNPTNITVSVQRVGADLSNYTVKSKLRSYDQYGLCLSESAWHTTNQTYTLPLVPQTIFLVPDFGDKSTELYICDYQGVDTTKIYGHVYNAENGNIITSAKVQIDASHSTYSDDSGFYLIRTNPGSHILTVTKDGYQNWQETINFPYAGNYELDIPLIPEYPAHTGHGILGIVRVLPYYLPAENQLVHIRNATWLNTTYTNNVGYYLFDNLEVGDYWINVSKSGYIDNNQLVTVSATGDVVVTIDACDATTDWQSDNSLTLNTTDKQEGTGSLQSSGSATLDFNKSASTAVDASNVTKSNGYLTFWYKVNDTSRLDDYITFTIGSNGNNDTNKISWSVYKANFVNDTWKEIWLKFSDGTETGMLNMSNINWTEVIAPKSDTVLSKIDNIRFYDFSYEIHNVDLAPISTEEEEAEGGVGVYYPPPHLVEFAVVDIWGRPLTSVNVIATGYETTVANLSWWQKLFGYSSEIEVYNCTMQGTTDDAGHISFFMVETIKYKMQFSGGTQNVSATYYIYPKDDRYTITIGTIPERKIAYWITTQQNNTANTGNITFHYCDYNIPVKTSWVNFSVYYMDNNTLTYTYNFTSINQTNENTSINLNASCAYRVKYVTNHADFGTITGYVSVVFLMPERPKMPVIRELMDNLEDWQVTMFSMFIIIFAAFIFGAVTSGIGGLVVAFMSYGFYYFGMMPLIPKAAAYVIFPLIIIVAVLNLLSEQKGVPEE